MDDGHVRDAEEVMAYLARKARSEWTVRRHRECLAGLAEHLRERGLGHSEDVAWEWLEGIAGGLDKTRRSSHVGALAKLGDTCATGETGSLRHGAPRGRAGHAGGTDGSWTTAAPACEARDWRRRPSATTALPRRDSPSTRGTAARGSWRTRPAPTWLASPWRAGTWPVAPRHAIGA